VLITTYICGDMTPSNNGRAMVTFAGCARAKPTSSTHRVVLVGYERKASIDDSYFILQNSWGERFGNHVRSFLRQH
jgi:C1A family cysteine protease